MRLVRVILACASVVLMSVIAIAPTYAVVADFADPFDYSTGDLAMQSGGVWVNLTDPVDVVTTPTGSASGPNVVGPHGTQVFQQAGRALGSAVNGDQYDFRLSVYAGNPAALDNDDMQLRITNNTSAFGPNIKNIVFQTGINDGQIKAQQGQTGGNGLYPSISAGNVTVAHWYELRALYDVKNGPDTVAIDYRDITAAGAWTNLAVFTMDVAIDNELSLSEANNFAINCRDWDRCRAGCRRRERHHHPRADEPDTLSAGHGRHLAGPALDGGRTE